MKVKIKYFAYLREITGKREDLVELEEDTSVGKLLEALSNKYGEKFREYIYGLGEFEGVSLNFLLNGRNISLDKMFETKLQDGDVLSILPPVAGG
ncbi:MAG: ubiquitin-like small modifier protein 1 [Candidatus Bathyarchaeia archaeon]